MRLKLLIGGVVFVMLSAVFSVARALTTSSNSGEGSPRTAEARPVPGVHQSPIKRDSFTPAEQEEGNRLARSAAARLVKDYPQLRGLSVESLGPVFMETSAEPAGVMVTYALPRAVSSIRMDIIHSLTTDGTLVPERIPSEVSNLRALDAIFLFGSDEILHLQPAPRMEDVNEPDKPTKVRTLDPAAHRSPAFGGEDE